jgi:ubiquinone/menaquinone biosynthesis C-methylase UbiE
MIKSLKEIFVVEHHVCPWWFAYTFDHPLRRLVHDPEKIFKGLVREGQTAMDIGCGMGYFSIGLAKMVGQTGRVIAVDLQQKMLDVLGRRAEKAGVRSRIRTHQCEEKRLGISDGADFILACWVVHEIPDQLRLFKEIHGILKAGGYFLLAEPKLHVPDYKFAEIADAAREAGLKPLSEHPVAMSRAILFTV